MKRIVLHQFTGSQSAVTRLPWALLLVGGLVLSLLQGMVLMVVLAPLNQTLAQEKPAEPKQPKQGIISGTVRDKNTQEVLIGAAILVEGTTKGAVTDLEGRFKLTASTGSLNLRVTSVGYKPTTLYNLVLTSGNVLEVNVELLENDAQTTSEIEVVANTKSSVQVTKIETPLSIQNLTTEEIKSNPGGNFDISRVVQALPGVAGATGGGLGFRNDIIIRGGAPNENVYYLDGIEIPVINHFQTQGSSGGPAGILNVSFIEDVTLSSSAFDARYDNALASVFQFKQKEGSRERLQGNVRLSGTELATTLEGPLGPKTTFLASARRSYLQFLFQAIDLPIRPNYWDFQYKVTHRLTPKTTITTLGVGAIDEFAFAVPRRTTPDKEYAIRSNPSVNQWNYTVGASMKTLIDKGFINVSLSRNMFDNQLDRFEDNVKEESRRALGIKSQEIENKFRADITKFVGPWKVTAGVMAQYVKFNNNLFTKLTNPIQDSTGAVIAPARFLRYNSAIDFFRYGAFAQVSRYVLDDKLALSFGVRTDMNSFTTTGNNPLESLSPRASASYSVTEQFRINASVGTYYKLPIYTVLGYKDAEGNLVNKDAKYLRSTHYVAGIEWLPRSSTRITVEGFYKDYGNYPVSLLDGISLANKGADFSAVGNEPVQTNGKGRAYGAEIFLQQKLTENFYGVLSYTLVRSEFSGANGNLIASSWDSGHLLSVLAGYKFSRGWEVGAKYRFAGGTPYTPFDLITSRQNFLTLGRGTLDLNSVNANRVGNFNQVDFRVDKKWNLTRSTIDVYLDVTNVFAFRNPAPPQYTFQRTEDNSTWATTDGNPVRQDGANALPIFLNNDDALVLPTIGFIVEF